MYRNVLRQKPISTAKREKTLSWGKKEESEVRK